MTTSLDRAHAQRRTLGALSVGQVLGNLGAGAAPSVGILLATAVGHSESWAGVARSATTIGSAIAAIPLGALALRWGRRGALGAAFLTAAVGSGVIVASAIAESTILLIVGMLGLGVGVAANFQMRFAAADLAVPASRARAIAIVVWVGTLGSVLGPNLGVPGQWVEERWGLPDYSGAFALAAVLMALAGLAILVLLRPDPLLLALRLRAGSASGADRPVPPDDGPVAVSGAGAEAETAPPAAEVGGAAPAGEAVAAVPADESGAAVPAAESGAGTAPLVTTRRPRVRAALRLVLGIPKARFALVSQVLAHLVMVAVMTMTPVHLEHHTPHHHVVTVVGIVISFHVIGMFGFAPLVGILSDRLGPVPVILMGQVVLTAGSVICAVAGESNVVVGVGLFLVGLGWSIVTVPSAALLTGSVTAAQRPVVQGTGDMLMNAVAAIGAMVSGPVVSYLGFPTLCLATLPFMALVTVLAFRLRRVADWSPTDPLS